MKKMLLTAVALIFASVMMSAQESHAFEKGYRGNVLVGGNVGVDKGFSHNAAGLTTSHGYSFGDGMYLGCGVGVAVDFSGNYARIPVFFDTKYNLVDWKLSPYVDCRVGMEMFAGVKGCAFIASPGVGFDYRKLSYRVGYQCEAGNGFKLNSISFAVAVSF